MFAFGTLLRGYPAVEMFAAAIAPALSVPEGLPAVTMIALALEGQRMVRQQPVARGLPAGGALGAATVICTDKTGTLTRNDTVARAGLMAGGTLVSVAIATPPRASACLPASRSIRDRLRHCGHWRWPACCATMPSSIAKLGMRNRVATRPVAGFAVLLLLAV